MWCFIRCIASRVLYFFTFRHMKEIAELQTQQKNEIEALYMRLGKPLPPNLGFLHSAPPSSRRRRTSKNKLKGGKLLNPLVQQLRSGTPSTSRYTRCLPYTHCLCQLGFCCVMAWTVGKALVFLVFNTTAQVCALQTGLELGFLWDRLLRAAQCWTIHIFSASVTMLGRETIFHFDLEYSPVTFSYSSSKCNLLMFVFTS